MRFIPTGLGKILAASALLATGAASASAYGDLVFSSPVTVEQTTLGVFDIDLYDAVLGNTTFGIAIGGRFTPSPDYALPDGYQYRWLQTVSTTLPAYSWQARPEGQEPGVFVDRSRDPDNEILARSHTPFYADGEGMTGTPPVLQFADNPSRELGPDEFRGTWVLSLVAVEAPRDPGQIFNQPEDGVTRAIYQLATFAWGFDATRRDDGSMAIDLRAIEQVPPDAIALASIFANDPDVATFGGGAWDIRTGLPAASPGVIPEPSSYLLALAALAAVPVLRGRQRPVP
ncbi:hypothetical protein [Paludisphaera sp.]|uniref:hypothetical protein n=1 Tax=Paludisphaera sp. TaxID=2017432 RepID=UPI00301BA3D8